MPALALKKGTKIVVYTPDGAPSRTIRLTEDGGMYSPTQSWRAVICSTDTVVKAEFVWDADHLPRVKSSVPAWATKNIQRGFAVFKRHGVYGLLPVDAFQRI